MDTIDIPHQSQAIVNDAEPVIEDFIREPDLEIPLKLEEMILYNLPPQCFPLFELSHYIITALTLRIEFGQQLSRQSPLASCCSMLISSMAGSLMSGLVLGSPPALAFRGDLTVLTILTVWLVVFFSPEDVVYRFVRQQQVLSLLWAAKEVDRMRKIVTGVAMVEEKYPDSVFLAIVVGVLKGNGTTIIRPLVRAMCGVPGLNNELLSPGLSTKLCIVATVAWISTVNTTISSTVYTMAVSTFLLVRLHIILDLSSIIQRLGFISINKNNQVLETETEDLSEKKDE